MHCSPTPVTRKYRRDIDGLRAIAVLSVFLFHLQPRLLPGGFLGVDVFFVISGYLITSIIVREHHQQCFSFAHFYARRIKRIFPALFVVLAMSACMAFLLLTPGTYDNFMVSGRYAAAQLSNFFFSQKVDYFSEGFSGQPLLHTWSLGVEEQFYLFWPLLIYICFRLFKGQNTLRPSNPSIHVVQSKRQNSLVGGDDTTRTHAINIRVAAIFFLLALVSFWVCYQLTESNYNYAFYMFYARAFEFCVGGALTLKIVPEIRTGRANIVVGAVGLILLCYSFLFIGEEFLGQSFLPFGVLIPCVGSGFIIHAHSKSSITNRLIATRFPVYVGKISYSLYLYHWPVIIFWKLYSGNQNLGWLESAVIVLVSFFLATLSYKYVEQPVRTLKTTNLKTIFSALMVIIVFSAGFKISENFADSTWRITRYDQEFSVQSNPLVVDCDKTIKDGTKFYQCQETSVEDTPVIALIGDSHAPHYFRSATSWARKNGYNLKYIAVPGCPMVIGDVSIQQTIFEEKYTRSCERSQSLLKQNIVDDPRVEIVMIAQRYDLLYDGKGYLNNVRIITFKDQEGGVVDDHTGYYEDRLSETVTLLKAAGKQVVILKQVPINVGVDSCTYEPLIFKMFNEEKKCEYDYEFLSEWQQPSIDFMDTFCQDHNLAMFDPAPAMDKPHDNGINLYQDRDHLSEYGVSYLVPYFEQYMDVVKDTRVEISN